MSKAIYVGFTAKNTPALSVLLERSSDVSELIPLSFSPKTIDLLRRILGEKLSKIIAGRPWTKRLAGVHRRYYGLIFVLNPILNHLNIRTFMKLDLRRFALKFDSFFLRLLVNKYELRIIPGDFLESIPHGPGNNVLEVRWHHTLYNNKRPDLLLNYPIKQVLKETRWESILREKIEDIDLIVTYSSIAKDSFIYAGYEPKKIAVVPLDIDLIADLEINIGKTEKKNRLMYVGRDAPDKGLDIAVFAAKHTNLDLIVVGSYSREVENWLKSFNFVHYKGILSRTELFTLMSETEVLIIPSIESFGLAVLEGIQAGMKIVASPFVGVLEYLGEDDQIFKAKSLEVQDICEQLVNAIHSDRSRISRKTAIGLDTQRHWGSALDCL
jgi:glycosyltransferase involved in cell wall biosynthesis